MIARLNYIGSCAWRYFLLVCAVLCFVAFVLRYPTSADLSLVPLDPIFPLHALAALDLSDGGSGFVNTRLEFPDGAPIRYLAWPLLFCSLLFEGSLHPVAAFHLGILTWLTLQGVMMMYLFHDFLEDRLVHFCRCNTGFVCATGVDRPWKCTV